MSIAESSRALRGRRSGRAVTVRGLQVLPLSQEGSESRGCLEREHAVAKCSHLLVGGQIAGQVRNPAPFKSHEPFEELQSRSRRAGLLKECRARSLKAGDVLPAGYGIGVSSPAMKMPSISDHSVSDSFRHAGEP